MKSDVIETGTARLWLGEDGILRGVISAGVEEKLEDAQANVAAAMKLAGDKMVPVLIDLRQMKSITHDARKYYAGEEPARYSLALALIVESPLSKVIGNFFIGLNKTSFPTRLFTREQEAVDWLKGFAK